MTKLYRTLDSLKDIKQPVVAALGKFDGMHIGHTKILEKLEAAKNKHNGSALLISFYPNPAKVIQPGGEYPTITTLQQRLDIMESYGIDVYLLMRFSLEFSKITAEEFINGILLRDLNIEHLIIGEDAAVGYQKKGTAKVIQKHFQEASRTTEIVNFAEYQGFKVATGWLRESILAGDMLTFKKLTGRNYVISSRIIHGDARGHKLGFPTANLKPSLQILPMSGIYATKARIGQETFPSVTSVGFRPTFGGNDKIAEVHLIDFPDKDLYGKKVHLEFIQLLREEVKYNSVSDLTRQIHVDIENAREILNS